MMYNVFVASEMLYKTNSTRYLFDSYVLRCFKLKIGKFRSTLILLFLSLLYYSVWVESITKSSAIDAAELTAQKYQDSPLQLPFSLPPTKTLFRKLVAFCT